MGYLRLRYDLYFFYALSQRAQAIYLADGAHSTGALPHRRDFYACSLLERRVDFSHGARAEDDFDGFAKRACIINAAGFA